MDAIRLILPWPPSVNGYWRAVNGRQILSAKARAYRTKVLVNVSFNAPPRRLTSDLRITEHFYPPDNRRRDIDNARKAYRDALSHCGVWEDDSQVKEDHGYMMAKDAANPRVEVWIEAKENA